MNDMQKIIPFLALCYVLIFKNLVYDLWWVRIKMNLCYRLCTRFMIKLFTWPCIIRESWRKSLVSSLFDVVQLLWLFIYLFLFHKKFRCFFAGVEPWTIVQKLGEAIFIPAGCPHQVRNLKVSKFLDMPFYT